MDFLEADILGEWSKSLLCIRTGLINHQTSVFFLQFWLIFLTRTSYLQSRAFFSPANCLDRCLLHSHQSENSTSAYSKLSVGRRTNSWSNSKQHERPMDSVGFVFCDHNVLWLSVCGRHAVSRWVCNAILPDEKADHRHNLSSESSYIRDGLAFFVTLKLWSHEWRILIDLDRVVSKHVCMHAWLGSELCFGIERCAHHAGIKKMNILYYVGKS